MMSSSKLSCSFPSLIIVQEKRGDIPRIHLTRVVGHGGGKVKIADDRDAVFDDFLAGLGEFAVSTALGGQIDNHRTRRHPRNHFTRHQHGRFLARNHGGRDHDVAFGDHLAQQFALTPVEILILRFRVAARVLRVLGLDRELDETPAEALNLLFGGRPQIVRGNNRARACAPWRSPEVRPRRRQ